MDGLDLGGIHGDAGGGDGVPQVGHGVHPKTALGAFDEQPVLPQELEDDAEVPEMICLGDAIDQDVIEKD